MNKVELIGRITKDLELRKSQSNKSTVQFNLAINRKFKNEEGKYDADFISCIAWNQNADYLCQYAHKGDLISVCGRIQTRTYDGQNGRVYVTEVICEEVSILNSKISKEVNNYEEALSKKDNFCKSLKIGNEYIEEDDLPFY